MGLLDQRCIRRRLGGVDPVRLFDPGKRRHRACRLATGGWWFSPGAGPATTITNVRSLAMGGPRRQGQELLACAGVVADKALQCRGDGLGAGFLDAAQ
jgi:hypothetical protein